MPDEPIDALHDWYERARRENIAVRASSQEQFDKSVLTLSTSAIGFSIALLKIVEQPLSAAIVASWVGLGIAALSTLMSFTGSVASADFRLQVAFEYWTTGNAELLKQRGKAERITQALNVVSSVAFVIGLTTMVVGHSTTGGDEKKEVRPSAPKPGRVEKGLVPAPLPAAPRPSPAPNSGEAPANPGSTGTGASSGQAPKK